MEDRHPHRRGDVWFFTEKLDNGEYRAVVNCINIRCYRKGNSEKEALRKALNGILNDFPGERLWLEPWLELTK